MRFILLAGVNGSGKSTFVKEEPNNFEGLEMIDPDKIQKEQNLSLVATGRKVHTKIESLFENKQSFCQESTLSGNQPILLIKKAREKGYNTEIVYLSLKNIRESRKRIDYRVVRGGHDIPNEAINRRWERSFNNLVKTSKHADKITIYDNSERRKEILAIENNHIKVKNKIPEYLKPTIERFKEKGYSLEVKSLKNQS